MVHAVRLVLVLAITGPVGVHGLRGQDTPAPPKVSATTLLRTATTWDGTPIVYARTERPELQSVLVEIAPGAATGWHLHPVNNVAYILEGTLRLELEHGTTRTFKTGEAFAEVVNTWHRGVNTGKGPLRILVVYAGEMGRPLSVPRTGPSAE